MRKIYINRSLIISLVAIAATIILLTTIRSIYPGAAGAQTPTAEESALDSQTARRVKGEVYYDIKFSTDRVSRGKEKRFNVIVTAFNSKTGQVDKNPFQRVELTALPIAVSKTESGNTSWKPSGTFSENASSVYTEQISGYSYHGVTTSSGMRPVNHFDLINGVAEVSFSLTQTPADDNYVGFMATPTTWTIAPGLQSAKAYRLSLQSPRRPNGYTFLYKEWQTDDEISKYVFTIATLPVGNAAQQSMTELGGWQKPVVDQPQSNVVQNIVVPPAANLTQPIYGETTPANSPLVLWLWLVGSFIVLTLMALGWLALKKRSQKVKS
jgi:hypothetical protein